MRRVRSILYHDVVAAGADDASGFPGAAAARYKLERGEFARHLDRMAERIRSLPVVFGDVSALGDESGSAQFLITFDDGGSSSMHIADALEKHGWRGNFFITTDRIGTPGFVSREDIGELDRRGHGIGSHSASHPYRIADLDSSALDQEWSRSVASLSDILGRAVADASVPGGYYAPRVAMAAARAGVRQLYTSEPTTLVDHVDSCMVLGRFCVYRGMSDSHAAALAAGAAWAVAQQKAMWKAKGVIKTVAAPVWEMIRSRVFAKG
jgi:peptidoglycan/xylan/chitin deacetylase (PgdA/CDA1 family)